MDRSAYIVTNKQQEYDVLNKLEKTGIIWNDERKPTEYIPSYSTIIGFPYVIYSYDDGTLTHDGLSHINDKMEIVYDGRKEERPISVDSFEKSINKKELIDILKGFDLIKEKNIGDKYVVSQEFMNKLKKWKDGIRHEWFDKKADGKWLNSTDISDLESITEDWWLDTEISCKENNNRLIAIIRWVNGEDVFEVEKLKKWVVRDKVKDVEGDYWYVLVKKDYGVEYTSRHTSYSNNYTKFDTKEEAESWANSHQEVIEVEG